MTRSSSRCRCRPAAHVRLAHLRRSRSGGWPGSTRPWAGRCLPLPAVRSDGGAAASQAWSRADSEVLGPVLVPVRPPGQRAPGRVGGPDRGRRPRAGRAFRAVRGQAARGPGARRRGHRARACCASAPSRRCGCSSSESKTVKNGPFYSEYLPAETIMAASLTLRGAGRHRGQQGRRCASCCTGSCCRSAETRPSARG